MLALTVALASYAAVNLLLSIVVAMLWRMRGAVPAVTEPRARARGLAALRAVPSLGAIVFTAAVVAPAFVLFEPHHESESAGPIVIGLAAVALAQIGVALSLAAIALVRTRTAERAWLRSAMPIDVAPAFGGHAYAVDTGTPIVALVGIFTPKLIADRTVIESCTAAEFAALEAHERGHLRARDNLKRWLMASAPDALRWTRCHAQLTSAWHDAAEDAADDVAAGRNTASRVDLAALIVKIARLAPEPSWPTAAVSPFVDRVGLDRRVRRLLDSGTEPAGNTLKAPMAIAALLVTAIVVTSGVGFREVYDFVEAVIRFWR